VALKIVPSGPMTGSRERKRWLSEAQCVTRVRHPNIVQLHDAAEAGGWLYLVLEYIPGGSLKDRLRGPVSPRAAVEFMTRVVAAMSAVHEAGLLHLDLKPSNILIDSAPDSSWKGASPKVADFGIARPLTDLNATGTSFAGPWGTPSYMAPEQLVADRMVLGPATDVYALGAILYELLTGRPPFQGTSTLETLDQVRSYNPVPPRRLNPKIPRDLETIALKCLEKNPARRYTSTVPLADDLDRFLAGRPITARPVSPIEHAWRWCRRQPVIATLGAALFLTVIGSFLGLLLLLHRSEAQRTYSEANYQAASQALDEMVTILSESPIIDAPFVNLDLKVKKTLEVVRSQQLGLSKRYPPDAAGLKRLAFVDRYLATFSFSEGKPEEARPLIEECIKSCESYLALRPGEIETQRKQFEAAAVTVSSLTGSGSDQLYDLWNARALAALEPLKSREADHAYGVSGLSRAHRGYADSLLLQGETERARKALEEDLAFVSSELVAETKHSEIALSEALPLAALGRWSGEFDSSQFADWPQPTSGSSPILERDLAELAARRLGWLPSIVRLPLSIPDDLSAEAWADRFISSIEADTAKFHIDRMRIPAVVWWLKQPHHTAASNQRHIGNLREAQRITDRFIALAERLTRSYPDQVEASMLLAEACVQKAKNAYRADEATVIEQWELKALSAAVHALSLEPANNEARALVADRLIRLHKIRQSGDLNSAWLHRPH
jgi:serine/threonine protein kinase